MLAGGASSPSQGMQMGLGDDHALHSPVACVLESIRNPMSCETCQLSPLPLAHICRSVHALNAGVVAD